MSDWLHNLSILWMSLLVFGLTALGTASDLYYCHCAGGRRASSFFQSLSPPFCYRRSASSFPSLLRSPPRKFGVTTIRLVQSSIARLAH